MKQAKRSISIISFSTFILMGCSGNVPGKEGSHRPYIESAPTADSLTIKTTKHSTTIRWKKVVSWNKSIDGRSLDFKVCGKRSNGTSLQCMDKTQTAFWKTFEAPKGFVVQHYSTDHEGLFTVVLLRTRLPVRLNGSKPLYKFIVVWAKKEPVVRFRTVQVIEAPFGTYKWVYFIEKRVLVFGESKVAYYEPLKDEMQPTTGYLMGLPMTKSIPRFAQIFRHDSSFLGLSAANGMVYHLERDHESWQPWTNRVGHSVYANTIATDGAGAIAMWRKGRTHGAQDTVQYQCSSQSLSHKQQLQPITTEGVKLLWLSKRGLAERNLIILRGRKVSLLTQWNGEVQLHLLPDNETAGSLLGLGRVDHRRFWIQTKENFYVGILERTTAPTCP